MTFLSSSYRTSTKAPPMPLSTLDQAPLKKALVPSSRAIFLQQSRVPVYMMSAGGRKCTFTHTSCLFLSCKAGGKNWKALLSAVCYLLCVPTASSCADGRYRRGRTPGRRRPSRSEQSSSSPLCVCSWGQGAFLQEKRKRER